MSGGGGGSQVVGYRYLFGIHMGVCRGPVDELVEARVGDRTAWTGSVTSNAEVPVDAYNLFGGEDGEGGVQGTMCVMMGGPTQVACAELVAMLEKEHGEESTFRVADGQDISITSTFSGPPTPPEEYFAGCEFRADGTVWAYYTLTSSQIGVWAQGAPITSYDLLSKVTFDYVYTPGSPDANDPFANPFGSLGWLDRPNRKFGTRAYSEPSVMTVYIKSAVSGTTLATWHVSCKVDAGSEGGGGG